MEAPKEGNNLPLPSVEAVLDKVKSDGTFDQFRKTCLAAVEAEPSMRAYGEQIEVLSRRYLQDHRHKWSDSITKNEVRARLKDYIVKMIANPDVGISIPVQNMVENSLEKNGPKILLPQIIDTVKALQKTAQEDAVVSTATHTSSAPPPLPPENSSNPEVVGPLDLPLPISIPGLHSSRKETSGGGGEQGVKAGTKKEGAAEQATVKVKTKTSTKTGASETSSSASTSTSSTGGASGGGGGGKVGKSGSQKSSQSKVTGLKQREKEDKSPAEEKNEDREKETADVENGVGKAKGVAVSGKGKKVDKACQKENSKQTEKKASTRDESAVTAKEVSKPETTGVSEKERVTVKEEKLEQKDPARPVEKKAIVKDEPAIAAKEAKSETIGTAEKPITKSDTKTDGEQVEPKEEGKEEEADEPVGDSNGGSSRRRKQSLPKRRSARLASTNEESSDEKANKTPSKQTTTTSSNNANSKSQGEEPGSAKDSNNSSSGRSSAPVGGHGRKMAIVLEKTKFSLKTSSGSGRKRLRVLESSSDEDTGTTQQGMNSDDEKGYESETEQVVKEEEDEEEEEGRERKRKRGRSKDKRLDQTDSSLSRSSEPQIILKRLASGQKRAMEVREEVGGGGNKSRSSSPAPKKVKGKQSGKQPHRDDRKLSPALKQKSPSPVVVTRYNRRVKPNRRYTSPTRGSGSSSESEQNIHSERH